MKILTSKIGRERIALLGLQVWDIKILKLDGTRATKTWILPPTEFEKIAEMAVYLWASRIESITLRNSLLNEIETHMNPTIFETPVHMNKRFVKDGLSVELDMFHLAEWKKISDWLDQLYKEHGYELQGESFKWS